MFVARATPYGVCLQSLVLTCLRTSENVVRLLGSSLWKPSFMQIPAPIFGFPVWASVSVISLQACACSVQL